MPEHRRPARIQDEPPNPDRISDPAHQSAHRNRSFVRGYDTIPSKKDRERTSTPNAYRRHQNRPAAIFTITAARRDYPASNEPECEQSMARMPLSEIDLNQVCFWSKMQRPKPALTQVINLLHGMLCIGSFESPSHGFR